MFRAEMSPRVLHSISGKRGLEIGGPSDVFDYAIPIYRNIGSLDNCVFAQTTLWEGERGAGMSFRYCRGKRAGVNFIAEGSELGCIEDSSYDFILSCHSLEHIANPLKALHNWKRVLRRAGFLLLVLPDKERTFDYRRPVTTLEHLRQDFENNTPEDDTTHIEEFVTLWDYQKYPEFKNMEEHRRRYQENLGKRLVHHHVFTMASAAQMLEYAGFHIHATEKLWPHHLVIFAQNPESEGSS
jgi:SAM-dependent methyltransferase